MEGGIQWMVYHAKESQALDALKTGCLTTGFEDETGLFCG